jgi:hypothetical protein
MSLPPAEFRFMTATIHISAWEDPVVDLLGHDPRSTYVERFWLPILGPSTTFLMRHLAQRLDAAPEGFDLPLEEAAVTLGLGLRGGYSSPFVRALARTGQFRLSQPVGGDALQVRRRIPSLTRSQVNRLTPPLRDQHDAWEQDARSEPSIEQRRTRARRLALSLLELGESDEATEQQLHRWKIHPALAHEALRWAHLRRGSRPVPGAAPGPVTPPPIAPTAAPPVPAPAGAA